LQPIVRFGAVGAGGKSILDQSIVKEIASIIAGKRPPSAIGATPTGGEAYDEQLCIEVAEARYRSVMPGRLRRA